MFGRHEAATKQETQVLAVHQDSDPEMRDEIDPDPLIEEMVERLRSGLGSLVAFDEWGRPLAWRQVVRIAAGPTLAALRDAQTAVALAQHPGQVAAAPEAMPAPEAAAAPEATPAPFVATEVATEVGTEVAPEAPEPAMPEESAPREPVLGPEPTAAPELIVLPEPTQTPAVTPEPQQPVSVEQPLPKPTWTYQPTATGWVTAPTTFGLRQIELEARRDGGYDAGYAAPSDRSEF